MKIGSEENFIVLDIQFECHSELPNYGDALIGIVVSSHGYCGKNQVWVSQSVMQGFGRALLELEKNRQGEAHLASISPGELFLKVYAYSGLGQLAIEGETRHLVTGPVNFYHSVKFGFVLEPEHLVKMSKLK